MSRELPLYNILKKRAEDGAIRFHMPGHKGKNIPESPLAGACAIDFTELYGTGNLYDGVFPIADAERCAARAWRVPQAFFLTGGASMGNMAMLSLVRQRTDRILVDRGSHRSVYNAVGLNDFKPTYLFPNYMQPFGVAAPYTAEQIEAALSQNPDIGAVIITCPTYYGVCADIETISEVCHKCGALLLVDEAHGAHFPFMSGKKSAVEAGADFAVCSLHKTLPALGQAALLLANNEFLDYQIRRATSLFGTSSPSYQVMASMDLARDFMEHEGKEICERHAILLDKIRKDIASRGIFLPLRQTGDPLRLCVMTSCGGISGYRAAQILEDEFKIVCEMADERQVLFIITAADTQEELKLLADALHALEKRAKSALCDAKPPEIAPKVKFTIGQALRREAVNVKLCNAAGCVAATNICPYPPGIPVIAVGEVIEQSHLEYLYHNGFTEDDFVQVIK